jgi:hypothetical protein
VIKPALWMIGAAVGAWLAVSAATPVNPEAFYGLLAPLVSAVVSWMVVYRVWSANPARLTGAMMIGFGLKLLFFGAYLVAVIRGLELRPAPFMLSFAGFFIGLHLLEALFLKRLFAGAAGRETAQA